MAYTQTDLDNIKKAIATGALSVRIEGKEVTYRDLNEMLRVQSLIEGEVNISTRKRVRAFQIIGEKGL